MGKRIIYSVQVGSEKRRTVTEWSPDKESGQAVTGREGIGTRCDEQRIIKILEINHINFIYLCNSVIPVRN